MYAASPGFEPRHPVERVECLVVPAELDERVPDDAVRAGLNRVRHARGRPVSDGTPSPREPFAEEVARERQRSEAALGKGARRSQPERVVQDAVGLGVIGGVAGLTGALLVLEAKERERAGVVGLGAEPGLKLADRGRRVAGGRERGDDSRERRRGRIRGLRRRGGRLGEDPAEQGRARRDTDHDEREEEPARAQAPPDRARAPVHPSGRFRWIRFRPSHGAASNGNAAGRGLSLTLMPSAAWALM